MSMTLKELSGHADDMQAQLDHYRKALPDMHPGAARRVRGVIAALEPRVAELREQCARMTSRRTAPCRTEGIPAPAPVIVV